MALGSALSPPALRGTSLALLGTATSVARLLASVDLRRALGHARHGEGDRLLRPSPWWRRCCVGARGARARPGGGGGCLRRPSTRDRRSVCVRPGRGRVRGGGGGVGRAERGCAAPARAAGPRTARPGPRSVPAAAARWSSAASTARTRPLRAHRLGRARVAAAPTVSAAPACERAYFAAGRGLCLSRAGALGASVRVRILGEDLTPRRELKLPGVPSRARISPDGRSAP